MLGTQLANAFGVMPGPKLANAFGVVPGPKLANAFGVFILFRSTHTNFVEVFQQIRRIVVDPVRTGSL
jgi:predicted outer membrane lipoprotein